MFEIHPAADEIFLTRYRLKTLVKLKQQSEGFRGDVSEPVSSFNSFVFIMHLFQREVFVSNVRSCFSSDLTLLTETRALNSL